MMNLKFLLGLFAMVVISVKISAQADTAVLQGSDEVVITATRTERNLANVAVPVTIINQKTIQQAGSLRLADVIKEQTGLFLTSGFGAGVQMQGLDPAYTLIMVDGEPLIGRTAGVLDLNRVTIGNIKKIEIVKGPVSSLYGSEALAGVINIITDKSYKDHLDLSARYGTYKTFDGNLKASTRLGKLGVNAFYNFYRTDGYSIRPFSVIRPVLPIKRSTPQVQLEYAFSNKTRLNLGLRYNHELILNEIYTSNNGATTLSKGRELNKDWNITPTLTTLVGENLKITMRGYATMYNGSQLLTTGQDYVYDDYQKHRFYRLENQTDYSFSEKLDFTAGAGYVLEKINSTRYDKSSGIKENSIAYGFLQSEFQATGKLRMIGGLRYDHNQLYAGALSPKLALQLKASPRLILTSSIGRGFRAPDFSKLYLNFTNTAAGSYSVYGSIDAVRLINELDDLGLIAYKRQDFYRIKELKPEISTGINLGGSYEMLDNLHLKANLFYNDITNLIDAREVAGRIISVEPEQVSQVFSYVNVNRAFTTGAEVNVDYIQNRWTIGMGYQFLLTADRSELDDIKKGSVFTRNPDMTSRKMDWYEYRGLPDRSMHMANLKFSYEKPDDWFAGMRFIYRSKWVPNANDSNGNGVYDRFDEFAAGYALFNVSAGKYFSNGLRLQAGTDNLLNYTDPNFQPNLAGRSFYVLAGFTLNHFRK